MEAIRIADVPVEELVGESWEGVLRRLTSDMDPWDVDLTELAHRFRDYIQALRDMKFDIPGRMVLACSVILRMKSDELLAAERMTERDGLVSEIEDAMEEIEDEWIAPVEPEQFDMPVLRRPRRQVALIDLKQALHAALKVSHRRAERLIEQVDFEEDDPFERFSIGGTDFSDRLTHLFDKIRDLLSGRRILSFFRLLERGDKEERIRCFFEVLHLAASGDIECTQDEFLGDILITMGERE